jgi:hypothetical protein
VCLCGPGGLTTPHAQVEDFCRSLGAKVQSNLSKNATHVVTPDGQTPDMLKVKVAPRTLHSSCHLTRSCDRFLAPFARRTPGSTRSPSR